MTWDGSGTHNRIHNFSADASAGIQAQAVRFDAEFNDVSTALENCQTLTGETTPTANSPMGGFKHTGVAVATSTDNYLRADQQAQQTAIYIRDTNTGVSGTMSASAAVFPTAFTDGQRITVKVSALASTSAPMVIIINGLSANIVDNSGSALVGSYLFKDGMFDLIYDSSASAFRMLNTSIPAGTITVKDASSLFTGANVETALAELASAAVVLSNATNTVGVIKGASEWRVGHSASTSALSADSVLLLSMSAGATYEITGQIRLIFASATSAAGIQFRFGQDGAFPGGHYISRAIPIGVTASTSAGDLRNFEARGWGDTVHVSAGVDGKVIDIHGIWPASTTAIATLRLSWDAIVSADASVGIGIYSFFKAEKIT